ncbi:MAG: hypothetical protein ACMUEK_03045 [Sodalis sp. (in: enterobacteria)]
MAATSVKLYGGIAVAIPTAIQVVKLSNTLCATARVAFLLIKPFRQNLVHNRQGLAPIPRTEVKHILI